MTKLTKAHEELKARAETAIRQIEAMEAKAAKLHAAHMAAINALINALTPTESAFDRRMREYAERTADERSIPERDPDDARDDMQDRSGA